jgi:hypothetical protein
MFNGRRRAAPGATLAAVGSPRASRTSSTIASLERSGVSAVEPVQVSLVIQSFLIREQIKNMDDLRAKLPDLEPRPCHLAFWIRSSTF